MTLTQITEKGIKDGEIINADINASAAIARTKLANVDLVDDTSPQLGGDLDTNSHNIRLDDNHYVYFGDSDDFSIRHDGTYNRFKGANFIFNNAAGNQSIIEAYEGGAVNLYHANSKKIDTVTGGARIFGYLSMQGTGGHIYLPDSAQLKVGSGEDLQIYHDGGHSTILDNGTGNLKIYTNGAGVDIQKSNGENMALFKTDGAVELYHDNIKQLETFDLGIDIGTSATGNFGIRWGGTNFNYCNIWAEHGSGDLFLAGGLKPKVSNSGFFSSYTGNFERSAIQINAFGGNGIQFYTSAAQNVTKDDAITVKEHFRILPNGDLRTSSDDVSTNFGLIDGWNASGTGNFIISADHGTTGTNSSSDGSAILFKTRGGERARIQHLGGISFNGDTSQANALDDYEEGSWTPVVEGTTTTGTVNYVARAGFYTKIGNKVFWEFYLNYNSGNGSGTIHISGLPYTVSNNGTYPSVNIGYVQQFSLRSDHHLYGLHASNSNYIYFYEMPDGGGSNVQPNYDGSASLIMSGHYEVN